tara:strand:- start:1316 stop:1582 length:267 start_codon:yes stop_codon:yes gene_type:complete
MKPKSYAELLKSVQEAGMGNRRVPRDAAHSWKNFNDPWAAMSAEDHKEANRLFKAAMKAYPSSPRQKELRAKLNALLTKYKIGEKQSS